MRCAGSEKAAAKPARPAGTRKWEAVEGLFSPLSSEALAGIEALPKALERVWPLKRQHRESLPRDIRELSRMLTSERADLTLPYWSRPAFISAYLYYFLPWNLIRLCSLIPSLPLLPPLAAGQSLPALYDAGSGPLSFILALWLSKQEWRSMPLRCAALDKSPQPLELGARLFRELAAILDSRTWPVRIIRGSVKALGRHALPDSHCWLITAVNVFNEASARPEKGGDEEEEMENGWEELFQDWSPLWRDSPDARVLIVEPGTRLGGSTVMAMREAAIASGLYPLSPCPHFGPCPLAEKRISRPGYSGSWCHFVFAPNAAPEWLEDLSRKAGLGKSSLSLSPLLLSPDGANKAATRHVRIISRPFPTGEAQSARYCCSGNGLGLLEDARDLVSGSLALATPSGRVDVKSGAQIMAPWREAGSQGKGASR